MNAIRLDVVQFVKILRKHFRGLLKLAVRGIFLNSIVSKLY